VESAVDLLTEHDLASLYALVQQKEEQRQQSDRSLMDALFAGLAGSGSGPSAHVKPPIVRHELDCKMTIVVRADKKSGITGGGTSAKLVSYAVIKAYDACKTYDPVSLL